MVVRVTTDEEALAQAVADLVRELEQAKERIWADKERQVALIGTCGRYRAALERIVKTNHDDMCSYNFGGPCECHIHVATEALKGE